MSCYVNFGQTICRDGDSICEGGLRIKGINKQSKSAKPLVSIITVVFNRQQYLERAITSVIDQTYDNIEYIIIDGGSTDGTLDIIKNYDNAIDYWVSEPDNGMYDALNKGIRLSNGNIIGILNSDDFYFKETVQTVIETADASPGDIYHGNLTIVKEYEDFCFLSQRKPDSNLSNLLKRPVVFHPTCFVKQTVYNDIGLFDSQFAIIADYDFLLRAYKHGCTFVYIDSNLTGYISGGLSDSSYKFIESFRLLKKHRMNGYVNLFL